MPFLDHIRACNSWNPADFMPFVVDGERLGTVRISLASALVRLRAEFCIRGDALHWQFVPEGFAARTEALHALCLELAQQGLISHLHGEQYAVTPGRREDARFLIDRACAPYFGVRAFGQHLNGFVRRDDGLHLWIGRRSANRRVAPNQLDQLVAGGLPWGVELAANLRKECWEEARLDADLAARARPVGIVSYCRDSSRGLKPDVIYCYDLELPPEFTPHCNDEEVQAFYCWPIAQVMATVRDTTDFKLNCNLVIIDFLIRHGLLGPEHPDYPAIAQGLRTPLGTW
ncbi:MAG: DUF4743 domain-containing protein [Chromatiaceae bacterium]|nr:MAG: DUF4743 domain-containing protein [Chromatiaceae bacterium]